MIIKEFTDIAKIIKTRGFSDRLYFLNFRLAWLFVIFCFLLNIVSGYLCVTDLSIITYGIPCAFGELGIHTAFIIWKAKVENCRKHNEDTTNIM